MRVLKEIAIWTVIIGALCALVWYSGCATIPTSQKNQQTGDGNKSSQQTGAFNVGDLFSSNSFELSVGGVGTLMLLQHLNSARHRTKLQRKVASLESDIRALMQKAVG